MLVALRNEELGVQIRSWDEERGGLGHGLSPSLVGISVLGLTETAHHALEHIV